MADDRDCVIEGNLTNEELQQVLSAKQLRDITFQDVTECPSQLFDQLSQLKFLKFLLFKNVSAPLDDIKNAQKMPKILHLNFESTPITDTDVQHLAHHPSLERVWLNDTRITDEALKALATIPNLTDLELDGTAVTETGMTYLAKAKSLNHLTIRRTAITDAGILNLAPLPKLSLTLACCKDTSITQQGLDRLSEERKRFAKNSKRGTTSASVSKPKKQMPVTDIPEAELIAAREVLYGFFKAMHELEKRWFEEFQEQKKSPTTVQRSIEQIRQDNKLKKDECQAIFSQYCTDKKRAYGKPNVISFGSPTEYDSEPEKEPITFVAMPTKSRMIIETEYVWINEDRHQYVLLKKDGRWLIDSKKRWDDGWKPNSL